MEAVKFVMLYGMELVVISVVGATLLAGLYQLVRDKVRSRASAPTAAPETAKR